MKNIVAAYAEKFWHDKREKIRMTVILAALGIVVAGIIFWQLRDTGVAMVNETCCGFQEHQHGEDCFALSLVCGLEETGESHTHDRSCYTTVQTLTCGLEEREGHIHDDGCLDENGNLICALAEGEGHSHGEDCFVTEELLICGLEEDPGTRHAHDSSCYELVLTCGEPEHVHTTVCMSDGSADTETAADWESTLPNDLSGVWAEDVAAIAESQLGYAESERNFQYDEASDTRRGYTRYGAWYGNEYGDWDAMFAAFCLEYAGVEGMPVSAGAYAWTAALTEAGLYAGADYMPNPGDLVFLNTENDSRADVVGIVESVDGDEITVIQGDSHDAVERISYDLRDEAVTGFGLLPEQTPYGEDAAIAVIPDTETEAEPDPAEETAAAESDAGETIVLETGEPAETAEPAETIPADPNGLTDRTVQAEICSGAAGVRTLSASESVVLSGIMPDNAGVTAVPVDVTIGDMTILAAYDITIYDGDGNIYEPEDGQIHVTITNAAIRQALEDGAEPAVYHIRDGSSLLESVEVTAAEDGAVEFDAGSFSIYIVGENYLYHHPGDEEDPVTVYTVEFYQYEFDASGSDNSRGPNLISTQYAAETDTLRQPAVPEYKHHVFDGWFTEMQISGENEPGSRFDFSRTLEENLESWTGYTAGEHNTIKLYTDYDPVYYVFFMTEETPVLDPGSTDLPYVFHTNTYHENDSVLDTTDVGILYWQQYLQAEQDEGDLTTYAVVDWYYYDGGSGAEHRVFISDMLDADGYFHVTDDMTLYPVVDSAVWIYFDMNAVSGYDEVYREPSPAYVMANAETVGDSLADPERPGYEFKGWYAENGTRVDSETTFADLSALAKDGAVTLYARWEPAAVGYTINIWRQKATDGAAGVNQKTVRAGETFADYIEYYDFAESIHVDAGSGGLKTGDTPTATVKNWSTYTGYGNLRDNTSGYYGFEYASARTLNELGTVEMAPDGSTVINIYYDRVTVTWKFGSGSSQRTLIGLYGTNCAQGDDPAGNYNDWPDPGDNRIWSSGSTSYTFETTFVIINSSASVTFTRSNGGSDSYYYYYLEITNRDQLSAEKEAEAESYGVDYIRQVEGKWYRYERRASGSAGSFTLTDKYAGYEVAGYNRVEHNSRDTGGRYTEASENTSVSVREDNGGFIVHTYTYYDLYIFNNARTYTITLVSSDVNVGFDAEGEQIDGGDGASYTFKYGQSLAAADFPAELDAELFGPAYYYEFTGTWWEDPTFTAEFRKPDSMPANNLVAYADWELKNITVTFRSAVESDLYDLLREGYGAYDEKTNPGGVADHGDGSFSIMITAGDSLSDILSELTAKKSGEGGTTTDDERYTFVSWMNGSGIFNVSGHLYDDTTLVASWNDAEKEHYMLYYDINLDGYNGTPYWTDRQDHSTDAGAGEELLPVGQVFNSANTGADLTEDQIKKFVCWNTQPDGKGTDYYPDDLFSFAGVEEYAVVYAKWATVLESVLHVHYNYPGGYDAGRSDEYPDLDITVENMGTIDLGEDDPENNVYFLHEGDEMTVSGVTYRFVGWSSNEEAQTPDDVEFPIDATVAVDGTDTTDDDGNVTRVNDIYAVWLAEPQFTIVKTDTAGEPLDGAVFTLSYDRTDAEGEGKTTWYLSADNDPGGNTIYSWTEADDPTDPPTITLGEITFTDHKGDLDGSEIFTLTEAAAPEGYEDPGGEITFHFDNSRNVVIDKNVTGHDGSVEGLAGAEGTVLTVQNEPRSYPVDIFKYTGEWETENVTALAGAEFVLSRTVTGTDADTGEETETVYYGVFEETEEDEQSGGILYYFAFKEWTTDLNKITDGLTASLVSGTDGFIHITGLPIGEYRMTETKAPDGYMLLSESVVFTVDPNGSIAADNAGTADYGDYKQVILVGNEPGKELPQTGGTGAWVFTAAGVMIMIGGAVYMLCLRKKKRDG